MGDLIDRKAILKHIEKIRQDALTMDDIRRTSIIMNGMDLCEKAVRNQPSAYPERQRGRWIEYIPEHGKCPFCGNQVDLLGGKANNFCGECGADMRGEQDE